MQGVCVNQIKALRIFARIDVLFVLSILALVLPRISSLRLGHFRVGGKYLKLLLRYVEFLLVESVLLL